MIVIRNWAFSWSNRAVWPWHKITYSRTRVWNSFTSFHIGVGKYMLHAFKDTCGCRFRDGCQDCCDHDYDPDEGYTCINCGAEGYEDMAGAAYDYYKDMFKYGE